MPTNPREWLLHQLALRADTLPVRSTSALLGRALHALNWANNDIHTNGEARLLRILGGVARTLLDVGAHQGAWAREALQACPNARIHCFEISSVVRQTLARNLGGASRIRIAPCGLAGTAGELPLKYYPRRAEVSSTFDYPHEEEHVWVCESVEPGDVYLDREGIQQVDLLKLDVEGAEHLVLQGFEHSFRQGRIKAVQFEYGRVNVLSRFLLYDFHAYFESRGFVVGKVQRNRVVFRTYRFEHETFFGGNYLAVDRKEQALIARLATAPG